MCSWFPDTETDSWTQTATKTKTAKAKNMVPGDVPTSRAAGVANFRRKAENSPTNPITVHPTVYLKLNFPDRPNRAVAIKKTTLTNPIMNK